MEKAKKEQVKKAKVDPAIALKLLKIQDEIKLSYKGVSSAHTGRPGK